MENSVQVNKILALFQELDEGTMDKIIKRLQQLRAKSSNYNSVDPAKKPDSIRDLAGVGADLWKDVDPDEYVRQLREEWD